MPETSKDYTRLCDKLDHQARAGHSYADGRERSQRQSGAIRRTKMHVN